MGCKVSGSIAGILKHHCRVDTNISGQLQKALANLEKPSTIASTPWDNRTSSKLSSKGWFINTYSVTLNTISVPMGREKADLPFQKCSVLTAGCRMVGVAKNLARMGPYHSRSWLCNQSNPSIRTQGNFHYGQCLSSKSCKWIDQLPGPCRDADPRVAANEGSSGEVLQANSGGTTAAETRN